MVLARIRLRNYNARGYSFSVFSDARGCDAILINCATEPGLIACRELLDAPVFGISEISLKMVMQSNLALQF